MILKELHTSNFRNLREINCIFKKNLTIITGDNAQGKTNLLEAISLAAHLKSFRTSAYEKLVNKKQKYFFITALFESDKKQKIEIKVGYSLLKKQKKILLNGKEVSRFSDLWGKIPLIYLIPDEHTITSGPPIERRNFLDKVISLTDLDYFNLLKKYQAILKQKNTLLLKSKKEKSKPFDLLEVYNKQCSEIAGSLIIKRIEFLNIYKQIFKTTLLKLSKVIGDCDLKYSSLINLENYQENLLKKLNENKELEIIRGSAMLGPHKDDLSFEINNYNLRYFGSKGQHKTFLMALKLAQIEYMKQSTGEKPILLIDDLHSELDEDKIKKFSEILDYNLQVFITDCNKNINFNFQDRKYEKLVVENGEIINNA